MKKILVVYNPVSGTRNIINIPKLVKHELEKRGYAYTWFETEPVPKQALGQFAGEHFDLIIAIGGDGTVYEVANFLLEHNLKTPLGIVANGSANFLATSLGIPVFPAQRALNFALYQKPQPLDAMLINKKHHGLIAAGQGYESVFIRGATRAMKRRFGFFAYVVSFFKTFLPYSKKPYNIVVDGTRYRTVGKAALIFNMIAITRGIPLDKKIKPNDGILNLIIINPRSILEMIGITFIFILGLSDRINPKIQKFTGKSMSINTKHGKEIQVDGEIFKGKNLQAEAKHQALQVIYKKEFK